MAIWFSKDKIYYQLTRTVSNRENEQQNSNISHKYKFDLTSENIESKIIGVSFVGANANAVISGEELLDYKCNYIIGNNPDKWQTDVPNFGFILYSNIYDGIDLKYYGDGKRLEYDFIVSPEGDPSQIIIKYEGAKISQLINQAVC